VQRANPSSPQSSESEMQVGAGCNCGVMGLGTLLNRWDDRFLPGDIRGVTKDGKRNIAFVKARGTQAAEHEGRCHALRLHRSGGNL